MAERTRVVDVRSTEWQATPERERAYIGRANPRHGLRRSRWANAFRAGVDGDRASVLRQYGYSLQHRPDLIQRIVPELRGKVLGCWCAPQPCHGDILARLADHDGELRPLCPVCLIRELEVEDCWQCHGEGRFHPADENPTEYDADEHEPCEECCGTGVTYWCECGKERSDG